MPDEPEVLGLLALMLFHDARRETRTGPGGELVLLDDQDRGRWNRSRIMDGRVTLDRALRMRRVGQYQLQAAIAGIHDDAASTEATDWAEIAALYGLLGRVAPSPVVELNRAVAVAMADGIEHGLGLVDELAAGGKLDDYPYLHSTRADLLRRLGRPAEAAAAYRRALDLTGNAPERAFLERRLREVAPD
jgi:RNA polymerase sigma-70 factor (ECF subfamily)